MAITLTKDAATLYDLNLHGAEKVWTRSSHRDAEADLDSYRRLGDTIQEYDTADREGNPLRVVLQIQRTPLRPGEADAGGVYEFAP